MIKLCEPFAAASPDSYFSFE